MGKLDGIFLKINQEKLLKEWKSGLDLEQYALFFGYNGDEVREEVTDEYESEHGRKPTEAKVQSLMRKILEEKAEDFFFERLDEIADSLKAHLEIEGDKAIVYREITVPDEGEFLVYLSSGLPMPKFKGIGVYWSFDRDSAQAHWGNGSHEHTVLMKGRVDLSDIDFKTTILLNLHPSLGEDEAEIRLKAGAKVEVVAINDESLPGRIQVPA